MTRPPWRRANLVPRVLLVTDPTFGDDAIVRCIEAAGPALARGALGVQLRDKRRARISLRIFAWRLRLATRRVGARLFVNGEPALARDVGADGVHLGGGAGSVARARAIVGPGGWISVAAHCDEDVRRAVSDGADAVLVSPVLPSRASPFEAAKLPRGFGALRAARSCAGAQMLVYALGGISAESAGACAAAGADGVAVVRALLASSDPGRAARAIDDAFARR